MNMQKIVIHKKLPFDLKNAIKDCLCNLFYRKKDLLEFFSSIGCTRSDMNGTSEGITKAANIDILLSNLELKQDGGILQKRKLRDSLLSWTDYDSYWFNNGSLDSGIAKKSVENLRKIMGKKTEQEKEVEEAKKRKERVNSIRVKNLKLEELNNCFKNLCSMQEETQKRGYELEKLLVNVFEFFGVKVEAPFKLVGEQIDGSFNFQGNNYILEAKWQNQQSANNHLYTFAYKIESNTLYPRGVLLSINGFSEDAVSRITHNKKPQLVLLDAADLILVLDGTISLPTLLEGKIKHAQTRGEIYVNAYKILEK